MPGVDYEATTSYGRGRGRGIDFSSYLSTFLVIAFTIFVFLTFSTLSTARLSESGNACNFPIYGIHNNEDYFWRFLFCTILLLVMLQVVVWILVPARRLSVFSGMIGFWRAGDEKKSNAWHLFVCGVIFFVQLFVLEVCLNQYLLYYFVPFYAEPVDNAKLAFLLSRLTFRFLQIFYTAEAVLSITAKLMDHSQDWFAENASSESDEEARKKKKKTFIITVFLRRNGNCPCFY